MYLSVFSETGGEFLKKYIINMDFISAVLYKKA